VVVTGECSIIRVARAWLVRHVGKRVHRLGVVGALVLLTGVAQAQQAPWRMALFRICHPMS
jgi:hypothetical protein